MHIAVPGCFILAKGNFIFGKHMVEKRRAVLKERQPNLRVEFHEYGDVHHGFAIRAIRSCEYNPTVMAARQVLTFQWCTSTHASSFCMCPRTTAAAMVLYPCSAALKSPTWALRLLQDALEYGLDFLKSIFGDKDK